MSCKNVEREKSKIETLKDSTTIEKNNKHKITLDNTQLISNSNNSENVSEKQVIKKNTNKLKFMFTETDSTNYFSYRQKYSNEITIDSTIVNEAGGSFTLPIKNTERKFNLIFDYDNCTYYGGFILNKHKWNKFLDFSPLA